MASELLDDVIETDYGQLDLVWGDEDVDLDRAFTGQVNGWVGAADRNGIYIVLARRSGGSHVRIVLHQTEPVMPDETWEDVVEVSAVVPADGAGWATWAGETNGTLDLPGGSYRTRVSARGRDAGAADEFAEDIVDHYLVEFWAAASQPDTVVRVGSDDARYWHEAWGSQR